MSLGRRTRIVGGLLVWTVALSGAACSKQTTDERALATPSFTASRARAPLGSPIEVTYRFVVASDAKFDQNYRVMVHFLDADDDQMWTDDHEPPTPTSQWKPGQTVEYRRTMFVPVYPYIGQATVRMGLYSGQDGHRVSLAGESNGQRSYKVGTIDLLPQQENILLIYKDGWHQAEVVNDGSAVEWQWTKRNATLTFKNPKKDIWLYLDLDARPDLAGGPQDLKVLVGGQQVDAVTITDQQPLIRKIPVTAAQLGTGDMVEVAIDTGRSFVPAQVPSAKSGDSRELGVRVFHAFVEPQ